MECDFIKVRCTNFGCETEVLKKDYEKHLEECEHKVIKCEKCETLISNN